VKKQTYICLRESKLIEMVILPSDSDLERELSFDQNVLEILKLKARKLHS